VGSAAAMAGGFSYATVAAPLDYRNPSGPKMRLAVVEHAATARTRPSPLPGCLAAAFHAQHPAAVNTDLGAGAGGASPVMKQVQGEAHRRNVDLVVLPTAEAIGVLTTTKARYVG
jgi:hypothetical protein